MSRKNERLEKAKTIEEFDKIEKELKAVLGSFEYSKVYGDESKKMKEELVNVDKISKLEKEAVRLSKAYLNKKLKELKCLLKILINDWQKYNS